MKFVYVEWVDSAIYREAELKASEIGSFTYNASCGHLIKQDKKSITLALDKRLDVDSFRFILIIPKIAITTLIEFNKPKRKPRH